MRPPTWRDRAVALWRAVRAPVTTVAVIVAVFWQIGIAGDAGRAGCFEGGNMSWQGSSCSAHQLTWKAWESLAVGAAILIAIAGVIVWAIATMVRDAYQSELKKRLEEE